MAHRRGNSGSIFPGPPQLGRSRPGRKWRHRHFDISLGLGLGPRGTMNDTHILLQVHDQDIARGPVGFGLDRAIESRRVPMVDKFEHLESGNPLRGGLAQSLLNGQNPLLANHSGENRGDQIIVNITIAKVDLVQIIQ